ncbi:MAG: hypothetical protein QXX12_04315 [Nanopusillaceae archaeon]
MEEVFKRRQSTSTNPEIVNQLEELENKIRLGYPGVEINLATFRHWSQIPKEIWDEIARKARVNKIDLSIHAPFISSQGNIFPILTGMRTSESGYIIDDLGKEKVAYELKSILDTAANLGRIYGDSIKVVIHATSAISGISWDKKYEEKLKEFLRENPEKFNDLKNKLVYLGLLKKEDLYKIKDPNDLPAWVFSISMPTVTELPKGYIITGYLDLYDRRHLSEKLMEMQEKIAKKEIEETIVDRLYKYNEEYFNKILRDVLEKIDKLGKEIKKLNNLYFERDLSTGFFLGYLNNLKMYIDDLYSTLSFIYSSYLYKKEEQNVEIKYVPLALNYLSELRKKIDNISEQIQNVSKEYGIGEIESRKKIREIIDNSNIYKDFLNLIEGKTYLILNFALQELENMRYPILKPFPAVAIDSAIDSFKRSLDRFLEDIKKDKEKLNSIDVVFPKIYFEHVYPEDAISRPEILKEFVEKARKALFEILDKHPEVKNKIVEKFGNLENFVDKYIGITLDVAHLKLFEKYGYEKEDIKRWINEMKPYIRHIHISESKYGEDVHIPLGMEKDEIIKMEIEELKDLLAEKGISVVHEVGGWYSGNFFKYFGPEYSYFISYTFPIKDYNVETFYKLPILPTYYASVYIADLPTLTMTYGGFSDVPLDLGSFGKQQR